MPATLDPTTDAGARALDHLERDVAGWLTSVDPDGGPHSSPIWFLWADGELLIYSRHRAPRNDYLAANPNVSFHLDSHAEGDEYATMTGVARFDADAPPADRNPAYLAKYGRKLDEYGWTAEQFAGDYPVAIRIAPVNWRLG